MDIGAPGSLAEVGRQPVAQRLHPGAESGVGLVGSHSRVEVMELTRKWLLG
ncbi:hypothetical protein [Streptomyces sp. NPDC021096]|uniref:hypothetical protein n=1 Tax=Streptomyces sp. NPDC021096 TaxID=3154792 RepID=UPI0033DE1F13